MRKASNSKLSTLSLISFNKGDLEFSKIIGVPTGVISSGSGVKIGVPYPTGTP